MSSFIHQVAKDIHGYHAICDEYLEGTETTRTPEFLRAYIEEKTDEITQLKEEIEELTNESVECRVIFDATIDEIAKLREENEKLKYWASEVIHYSHSASLDNLQAKKLITPDNKPTIADVRDFGKEIEELKEEIKKLKEEIYEFDALTGGLSEKKKLDVAKKSLIDFFHTMTESQAKTLAFKKNCEDGSPIEHQEIIAWMTQLLKERDEYEEELEEKNGQLYEQDAMAVQIENLEWAVEKTRKCWGMDFGIVDELKNGDAQDLFEDTLNEKYSQIDKLILKETQTHNNNVSLTAELEESKVVIDCLKNEIGLWAKDDIESKVVIDCLKKEIEKFKKENKRLFKYSQVMGEIDGDTMADLLADCGWEYNDDGELVKKDKLDCRMMTSDSEEEDSDSDDDDYDEGDVLMMLCGSPPTPDADEQYA